MKASLTLLAIPILIVSIVGSGRGQETRQVEDSGKPVSADRYIPMDGYRFHYSDQGTGDPVVVMDAGLCQTMKTWGDVPVAVAAFTRVFVYDRAGLGDSYKILPPGAKKSAGPPELRTGRQMMRELRDLLRKAGVPAPYVLVGHSFGGLNVRLYASEHPNEVAGIVLIDSSNEEEYPRYASLMPPGRQEKYARLNQGKNCEFVNLEASAVQLREGASLPQVPLTIITPAPRTMHLATSQTHLELQADLARRLPNIAHLFAERSGHFIQRDRPDIVVEAIRKVVEQARPFPIPLPTEEDFKQTRILHLSIPSEAYLSGVALALSGLAGWQWRKRKRDGKAQLNRARRRQALREEKDQKRGSRE